MQNDLENIRIVITSDSFSHRNYLQKKMEQSGIRVVLNEALNQNFINKLENIESDVLVFDAEAIEDEHLEFLEQLLEQTRIPVLINDVSGLTLNEPRAVSKWHNQLLEKIAGITGRSHWDEMLSENKVIRRHALEAGAEGELAKNVWVLGASLGGPDAIKRFLAEIPAWLPVTFIVAQHLGENFVTLLAEQLDRYTELKVQVPEEGHVLRHHEVLVMPTNQRLTINTVGAVEFKPVSEFTRYTPSIDMAIKDIARRYKGFAGAIIFSGMCDDGAAGCEVLVQQGGQVWVQDPDSCIISAMTESVAKRVAVTYTGTPELLAKQLVAQYSNRH